MKSNDVKLRGKPNSSPSKNGSAHKSLLEAGKIQSKLSGAENEHLAQCEAAIRKGWETFVEVGQALTDIRDRFLYRDTHPDFESYCREKWQFNRAHAYRQIGAAKTIQALSPIGDTALPQGVPLPTHESQVRPLVGLEPTVAREAWVGAFRASANGRVTARQVLAQLKRLKIPGTEKIARAISLKEKNRQIGLALDHLQDLVASTSVAKECAKELAQIRTWISPAPHF